MLEKTGIPTNEQVESAFPNATRLNQGQVAIIECFQSIPCDPCATSCPQKAIRPFTDINDLPIIHNESCNGCGICIFKCPGLAIMVVDMTYSETQALIKLPYEFSPLPTKGETVYALDRAGLIVAEAEVKNVMMPKSKTAIVTIAVDKAMVKTVRNFKLNRPEASILCRCSDISLDEIRQLIASGHHTVDEIKRLTRLGMGPCQGRTCIPLVMRELQVALGQPIDTINPGTHRPVVKSIKLGDLAKYSNNANNPRPTEERGMS